MPSSSVAEEEPEASIADGSGTSVADRMWNRSMQIKPVSQMRNGPAGAGYIS